MMKHLYSSLKIQTNNSVQLRFWQLQLQKTIFRGRNEGRSWGHKHPSTFYWRPGAAESVAQIQANTQESFIQLQKPKVKQSQRPLNLHSAKWSSISTSQKNTQRTTISGETMVDRAELSTHCFCRKGTVHTATVSQTHTDKWTILFDYGTILCLSYHSILSTAEFHTGIHDKGWTHRRSLEWEVEPWTPSVWLPWKMPSHATSP